MSASVETSDVLNRKNAALPARFHSLPRGPARLSALSVSKLPSAFSAASALERTQPKVPLERFGITWRAERLSRSSRRSVCVCERETREDYIREFTRRAVLLGVTWA